MALETEMETYRKALSSLASTHEGKFVVIHDVRIAGICDTYADAMRKGYEEFGLEPFLVKQINLLEKVLHFTREISCPT